jgi:tetratricopeptide (TPR) repeat protein
MTHRFADARRFLASAELDGAPSEEVSRLQLNIDQACGVDLGGSLTARRELARRSDRPGELVALGALLADLGEFAVADRAYRQALRVYRDVSPFPVAWIWFQRGVLPGELIRRPRQDDAAECYRTALEYLPR